MPRIYILVLVAVIPFGIYFVAKRIYWSYYRMPTQYAYTQEDYMRATERLQSNLKIDSGDIVFVGNSLTSNFPVSEMFGSVRFKNRGVGSNQTTHILNRIRPIAEARPSMIFIEGGINDLNSQRPVIEAFNTYARILLLIKEVSPDTWIVVQSTFPVCKESLPLQPTVDSLNALLKDHCKVNNVSFLNLDPLFRIGGKLDSSVTWDGIHLTFEGYKRWQDTVKHFIR